VSPRPQLKPRVTARIIADDPASLVSDATASVPRGCCGQALPHLERSPDVHDIVVAGTLSFPANFTFHRRHEPVPVRVVIGVKE
jgi:hypothetical protein